MNFGDRKTQMSSDAVPAMRTSPIRRAVRRSSACGDDLEADAARGLDQHGVAGADERRDERRGGRGGVGHVVDLAPPRDAAAIVGAASGPDGESRSTPAVAAWAPTSLVEGLLVGPELEHVPEHGDAAARRRRGEVVEGGAHRHRVGVVAVVDDDDARRRGPRAGRGSSLSATATRPRGSPPTARAAASAARALRRMCGARELRARGRPGARRRRRPARRSRCARRAAGGARAGLVGGDDRGAARRAARAAARPSRRRSPRSCRAARGGPGRRSRSRRRRARRSRASSAIWPGAAHRHLQDERLGARAARTRTVSGSPISVFRLRGGRHDAAVEREHRRQDVLRRRLAGRAGDRRRPGSPSGGATPCASARERRERVGRGDARAARLASEPAALGVLAATRTPQAPASSARARSARRRRAPRAGRRRGPRARPRASR